MRAQRPPRPPIDAWRPLGHHVEDERTQAGLARTLTVFLAGAECPFTCVFCDLWKQTTDAPTPRGALPQQLRLALASVHGAAPERIKLYNASNFFETRAVPAADLPAIASLVADFQVVTVECHPRLVLAGEGPAVFAASLRGRLEVAMGLETVHPDAAARLGKQMTLADYDAACAHLRARGIGIRSFVLLGAPFVPAAEAVAWAVRSIEHALAQGADVVSVIPVRGGDGTLERLAAEGTFRAPTLRQLEDALTAGLALGPGVVLADLWDAGRLAACDLCRGPRLERLARMNASGVLEPRVPCTCGT
ncbi:MAG: radical SAM protein [Vicinamibacteria bacterium]